jgi:hypothetical protein
VHEPGEPQRPEELPGQTPEELPVRGPQTPTTPPAPTSIWSITTRHPWPHRTPSIQFRLEMALWIRHEWRPARIVSRLK